MKLLSIDYGDSKTGLALGDTDSRLASPYKIIHYKKWGTLLNELKQLVEKENVEKIVIGVPTNLDERSGRQIQHIRDFIAELKNLVKIDIVEHDESMTTQQAGKLGAGKNDDDVAAMVLLQDYMDKQ